MKRNCIRSFKALLLLLVAVSLVGCKKSPDKILNECGPGVVLIMNQYYYKITLPTGKEWFFTGFDKNGEMENFTFDQDEIQKNRAVLTGTGFFIGDDGRILTNRHVAQPTIDFIDAKHSVKDVIEGLQQMVYEEMQQLKGRYDELQNTRSDCFLGVDDWGNYVYDEAKLQEISNEQEQLADAYNADQEVANQLDDIDVSEIKVETVCDVSVAYNNTFVTKASDFASCVVTAVSKEDDVDLAMLQLKTKKTPDTAYVFEISSDDSEQELTEGDKLYMIGFNAGFALSNTAQGIKAQITSGTVSQASDNSKVMYTIPALPGSSGSPVVDEYGDLAAVNFAGVSTTQNFNYGIRLKKVRTFVENN